MLSNAFVQLIIRHLLTSAGGAAIGSGLVSGADWETVSGAILTIVGVVMSAVEKRKRAK